ncbi:MAG: 7,8-dihydro-8-oxoguanine triphosphatase [bacterium P3]|nr:MAG: 7,8-dihydro-8-oxoguanine triphosphatase [bacterium P3]KWW40407.1 MAG: 7,8-dihydro-8-oxoguanine triphosphatase [bacterium F083]
MEQFVYRYPHPAVTADCVVFGLDGHNLKILLVERGTDPCKGMWAFPGGFMNIDETAEQCALRELKEETGLELRFIRQIGAFSEVHRDPRERVVTIAFYALTEVSAVCGNDDATQARWWDLDKTPPLAFDHDTILRQAVQFLRQDSLADANMSGGALLVADLQRLYDRYSAMPPSDSNTKQRFR